MRPITNYVRVIDLAAPASRHTGATNNIGAGGSTTMAPGTFFQQVTPQQADVSQPWAGSLEFYLTPWGFLKGAADEQRHRAAVDGKLHRADVESRGEGAVRQELHHQRLRERPATWSNASRRGWARTSWATCTSSPPTPGGRTSAARWRRRRSCRRAAAGRSSKSTSRRRRLNPADVATLAPAPAPPAGRGGGPARREAVAGGPPALTVTAEKLGDGLFRLTTGAGSYDSLLVEFRDHVMMLEAGQPEARSAGLHRRNEEDVPEQADPLRVEHAPALGPHRRAAGARGRGRDDHHAGEQQGVLREGAQHAANAAERHAGEEPEEGEDRDGRRRRRSTRTARGRWSSTTSTRRRTRTA